MVTQLALWVGAALLVWNSIRAFLGKIEPPQTRTAPQPAPPTAPGVPQTPADPSQEPPNIHSSSAVSSENGIDRPPPPAPSFREVVPAAAKTAKGTALVMTRAVLVLTLLFLGSTSLGLFIGGIVMLGGGDLLNAAFALLAGGFLAKWAVECFAALHKLRNATGNPRSSGNEKETGVEARSGHTDMAGAAPTSTHPVSAHPPPVLSLPEEFLLLSHPSTGTARDSIRGAAACAAAELGELAIRRRLRVIPTMKRKVFGFDVYFGTGRIHLLNTSPTGLAWGDALLAELEHHVTSNRRPIGVHKWYRLRGNEALLLHRAALIERFVLMHDFSGELLYPDPALRDGLISQLQAVSSGLAPMDEHMLLLSDLVSSAGLDDALGLRWSLRQRLDHARGVGAVAALPQDIRDTSTVLSRFVPSMRQGGSGG
ncbi:GPP34 family phosphoprotein, partial [Marinitenerispora sediminis]